MIIKGQKINDRYEIIRTIGEGGMANVFLAHDTILQRDVAVKILRGDLAADEKFVRRFQREAISASSLSHPNIVEMYDVGEDEGQYFIVMEYVNGKTLKSLIKKRGALTLPEVIDIMLQLTSAISCAHESYIIHRDIKPQNVMILEDGRVKITDFGIALALNSTELTQTNSVMGSVHYLPPEQANGTGSTVKSDIYSLGILMYELLTGKIPFKGETAVEIAIKQMKEQIPSVRDINPNIPQSVENIIIKACAKNPKNRYDNAGEMLHDLETCMSADRMEERRHVYKYPEHEIDIEKVAENLSRTEKNAEVQETTTTTEVEEEVVKEKPKKLNIVVWIIGIICAIIVLGVVFGTVFYIKSNTLEDVEIPSVAGMTEEAAITLLEKEGLTVNPKVEKISDEEIVEGLVVKTNPKAGKTVKEKYEVTLYISTGVQSIILENYVGKDFDVVKALLESDGYIVKSKLKEINDVDAGKYKENQILEQDLKEGEKLKVGETITFTIPNIITTYPDFVAEGYNEENVQNFCDKYGCNLNVVYEETNNFPEGTVFYQSREAGSKVVSSALLKIKVAKKVTEVPPVEEPTTPDDSTTEEPTE